MRQLRIFVATLVKTFPRILLQTLVKYLPVELYGNSLRYWYYKKNFFSLGADARIQNGCIFIHPEMIQMGKNSSIGHSSELNAGPGETPCLIIGEDTFLAPYCYIRTANHSYENLELSLPERGHIPNKVIIGNDVWCGAHCIFLPGAEIGDHSIVAAGSVVSGKLPPYSVIVGNPARVVQKRIK